MQLLFSWCCRNDSWVRKTGNEPQEHRCLKTSLSDTLSGFNAYLWVCSQVSSCLCLPFIWFEIQNFPKKHDWIITPQGNAFVKELRERRIIHHVSLPSLLSLQLRPKHEQPHCPCFLRQSSASQVSASQVLQ